MGRPTDCNEQLANRIAECIRNYGSVEVACDAEGINKSTFYEWMERGEIGESPFDAFANAIKTAQAQFQRAQLDGIQAVTERTWQARAWLLERLYPSRYSLKQQVEHSGTIATTATVNPADLQARRDDVMRQRQAQKH